MTYKEKAKMVMMLNKRMRDIVNKTGFNTQEFAFWQNRISGGVYKSIETTTAYTADDQEYNLISRRKSDIEKYTDEDLMELVDRTRKWSDIKKNVQQSMREQGEMGGTKNPYTGQQEFSMSEINKFLSMRKTINEWFEESADLVYELLEKTRWSDIQSHTTEEIYRELNKINKRSKHKTYTEKQKDVIRANYRDKRKKYLAKKEKALGR